MRMLLRVTIPVEKGTQALADGSLPKVIQALMEQIKPEAAYFLTLDGKRTALMVFDLAEPASIPAIAEPLFKSLNAEVDLSPVMNAEDLAKGLGSMPAGA